MSMYVAKKRGKLVLVIDTRPSKKIKAVKFTVGEKEYPTVELVRCPNCDRVVSSVMGNGGMFFCSEETLGVIEKVMYVCKCGWVLIANSDSLTDLDKGAWLKQVRGHK